MPETHALGRIIRASAALVADAVADISIVGAVTASQMRQSKSHTPSQPQYNANDATENQKHEQVRPPDLQACGSLLQPPQPPAGAPPAHPQCAADLRSHLHMHHMDSQPSTTRRDGVLRDTLRSGMNVELAAQDDQRVPCSPTNEMLGTFLHPVQTATAGQARSLRDLEVLPKY